MECTARDQRFRRGFTAVEQTELWSRRERGGSLKALGRAFNRPSSSDYCQIAPHAQRFNACVASTGAAVISGHFAMREQCPLYPQQRTFSVVNAMFAKCQKQTRAHILLTGVNCLA